MTYYTLLVVDEHKTLHTPARDRNDALLIFGKELGCKLTFEEPADAVATYLLDEWEHSPHWTNPTIPVFATQAT